MLKKSLKKVKKVFKKVFKFEKIKLKINLRDPHFPDLFTSKFANLVKANFSPYNYLLVRKFLPPLNGFNKN